MGNWLYCNESKSATHGEHSEEREATAKVEARSEGFSEPGRVPSQTIKERVEKVRDT